MNFPHFIASLSRLSNKSVEKTHWVKSYCATVLTSETSIPAKTSIGALMPASLNSAPSSGIATPKNDAPDSKACKATSIAPCPYALAFTTAMKLVFGFNNFLSSFIL